MLGNYTKAQRSCWQTPRWHASSLVFNLGSLPPEPEYLINTPDSSSICPYEKVCPHKSPVMLKMLRFSYRGWQVPLEEWMKAELPSQPDMPQDGLQPTAPWIVPSCKRHTGLKTDTPTMCACFRLGLRRSQCMGLGSGLTAAELWWLQSDRSGRTAPRVLPQGPGSLTSALGILAAGSSRHIPPHRPLHGLRPRSHVTFYLFFWTRNILPQ